MLPASFSIDDVAYEYDASKGLCRQLGHTPTVYDEKYVEDRYNKYGELGPRMAHLRLGYLLGTLGFTPRSVLDVGYGNGDFLRAASSIVPVVRGYDIPPAYPIAPIETVGSIYADAHDVVCFFDVLEHFPDPYEIRALQAKYVYISLPFLHPELGIDWFRTWRHRRPNEHLWHFSRQGLATFFAEIGYKQLRLGVVEDTIRRNAEQDRPNILTGIFERL